MKKSGLLIASLIFYLLGSPAASSETVLEQINRTGVVKLALRNDSPPFGYLNDNNQLTGLCLDFFALLKQKILTQLNRQTLTVIVYESSAANRFSLVENNQVYLECGPNTIRTNLPSNVTFSKSFFTTGVQFLVRPDKLREFDPEGGLTSMIIGVLRNTSTFDYIKNKYPDAIIQEFQGSIGRTRGLQALRQDKIDAFASDGILIIGETVRQGSTLYRKYKLVPELPLTCDEYGIILSDDPEWKNLVDLTITEMSEDKAVIGRWFEIVDIYLTKVRQACIK